MNYVNYLILAAFAALLVVTALSLPERGSPVAPLHAELSPAGSPGASAHYIRHSLDEARTPNMVTVVLADYRGFDTLGETIVVFTAGIACYLLLRRST